MTMKPKSIEEVRNAGLSAVSRWRDWVVSEWSGTSYLANAIAEIEKVEAVLIADILHVFTPDHSTTQSRFCKICGRYLTDDLHARGDTTCLR